MTASSKENSATAKVALLPKTESLLLYERKSKALKLVADCKQYITSKNITEELQERIDALKAQDTSLSTMETIVMLLDYVERETVAIAKLENEKGSFMVKSKNFFKTFLNIFE